MRKQKSRNISRTKKKGCALRARPKPAERELDNSALSANLPANWQEMILCTWLDWLNHPPMLKTTPRASSTKADLRIVRRQIADLKKHGPRFVDKDGAFNVDKAVASLEAEERNLLSERRNHTYECEFFGRSAPKELGNVDLAERYGVSVLALRRLAMLLSAKPVLAPKERTALPLIDPAIYDLLQKGLASRQVFVTAKAIRMRVRRLDEKIRAGLHMQWNRILEYQYRCFKYYWYFWFYRFELIPLAEFHSSLTLTEEELDLLRSVAPTAGKMF